MQSNDGALIFADLPSPADLGALQNESRRVLGALMTFARAVSTGATPPVPFVAQNEPVLPRFARRATITFAAWWARRDDPLLVADELTLLRRIATTAAPQLTVPLESATPEAVQNAAVLLEELDFSFVGFAFTDRPPLRSIAVLPKMLANPLRQINLNDNQLDDLAGIEAFTRLESLNVERNRLRDISALAAVAGLKGLQLRRNQIVDIGPLAHLTDLETLALDGNRIKNLDALAGSVNRRETKSA